MFHLIILEIFGKDPIRDFGFGFQGVIFDVGFGPASFPIIFFKEEEFVKNMSYKLLFLIGA